MLAILLKIICMYKRAYKKLYQIWMHKLHTLRSIVNISLVLLVASYRARFKEFKLGYKQFLQPLDPQHLSIHYHASRNKKLWRNSKFGFQGNTKPLTQKILIKQSVIPEDLWQNCHFNHFNCSIISRTIKLNILNIAHFWQ